MELHPGTPNSHTRVIHMLSLDKDQIESNAQKIGFNTGIEGNF